ncbi:MAG: NAD-dependent epimerase/dehydratase family protein [Desulfarculus sp.]|nr:NAD-dependent epimerase/dehydratase family protein [Desulfarculus sp.]
MAGSRVLITGGAGFIGSHIADQLLAAGAAEVVLLDNMLRGSLRNIESALATGKARLVQGTIEDQALVDGLTAGMDYCFHMAALRITRCAEFPREALNVMYGGTFNVLESCVKHQVKRLVAASSASVLGTADVFPTPESHHPYNNHTLYGAAKAANELMLRSFHDMFGLNYVAMRFFNVYGPRMDTHGKYTEVMIRWYRLIKEGKPPLIFGAGDQTMDFVHVADVARSCVLGLKADASDEVFNVARGEETSLKDLCQAMLAAMGSGLQPQHVPLPAERQKVEVARRLADVSKAGRLLGFSAALGLTEGLRDLVAWLETQPLDMQ